MAVELFPVLKEEGANVRWQCYIWYTITVQLLLLVDTRVRVRTIKRPKKKKRWPS